MLGFLLNYCSCRLFKMFQDWYQSMLILPICEPLLLFFYYLLCSFTEGSWHTHNHTAWTQCLNYTYNASCRILMLAMIIIFMTSECARKLSTQFHDTQLHESRARNYANYMYVWYMSECLLFATVCLHTTEHKFWTSANETNAFLIRHHTFQTSD